MGLTESELVLVYELLKKAELVELVALSGLVSALSEALVKESQDGLALLLDKHDKEMKK
jgi:hypothetical protein